MLKITNPMLYSVGDKEVLEGVSLVKKYQEVAK